MAFLRAQSHADKPTRAGCRPWGADKIAIVEAPFDARQNQSYLVDGYGWRLHDWKAQLADFVVYDVAATNNEVALFAYCLQDG